MTAQEVYREVEEALGIVPEFVKNVPEEAVDGFWSMLKNFQLGETAIPNKYKELIGLAVASQIPCSYCVTFHKEAAMLNGATEREIREAIGMGAMTRAGSTILNGLQQDVGEFHEEVRAIVRHVQEQAKAQEPMAQRR